MDSTVLESRVPFNVRSTDIDINAHVNNAKYLEYLEWGREDFYEQAQLPYDALLAQEIITMTVNVNLNYRKEARLNDALIVITRLGQIGRSSFTVGQTIIRAADDALIADAIITVVTVNAVTRKSMPIPAFMRNALEAPIHS